ncbi:MAG: tyrosine-protein phosphatase [Saprospiraceae bacterium]
MRLTYLIITAVVIALLGFGYYTYGESQHFLSEKIRTLSESVVVEKNDDGDYKIFFDQEGDYKIYKGDSPAKIDWDTPFATVSGSEIKFEKLSKDSRLYFGITGEQLAEPVIVSERLIPLKGTLNFRDIGGIPTQDGRVVKWGTIYRSGKLADLTKRDLRYFENLGIKTILDFRNDIEIEKDPDRYPTSYDILYKQYPIGGKSGATYVAYEAKVRSGEVTGSQSKDLFIELMRQFADSVAQDFKPVLDHIQNGNTTPLLYHCTSGKDRTGFATAMILSALNVDREIIVNDYMMSNFYRFKKIKGNLFKAKLVRMDAEMLSYVMQVNEDYINAVFTVIDEEHGGIDNYLTEQFGLTEAVREQLIQNYTYEIGEIAPLEVATIE